MTFTSIVSNTRVRMVCKATNYIIMTLFKKHYTVYAQKILRLDNFGVMQYRTSASSGYFMHINGVNAN